MKVERGKRFYATLSKVYFYFLFQDFFLRTFPGKGVIKIVNKYQVRTLCRSTLRQSLSRIDYESAFLSR